MRRKVRGAHDESGARTALINSHNRRRHAPSSHKGFTLLELVITLFILAIMTLGALPLVQTAVRRQRETRLREALREMRGAIEQFHRDAIGGPCAPAGGATQGAVPGEGQPGLGGDGRNATDVSGTLSTKKKVYLREIPVDPMTGKREWNLRSLYDNKESTSWGGENVFDVRSQSTATALNGEKYNEW
ncbi:MAG: prepilin-type N-terminal cleavage/methylation domain-containing protein [Acidobacteria bacterium]|nr:prepilin-type N-terminal cleavage/methylation domain-containing protein [Acidobacteriota bacterium]